MNSNFRSVDDRFSIGLAFGVITFFFVFLLPPPLFTTYCRWFVLPTLRSHSAGLPAVNCSGVHGLEYAFYICHFFCFKKNRG